MRTQRKEKTRSASYLCHGVSQARCTSLCHLPAQLAQQTHKKPPTTHTHHIHTPVQEYARPKSPVLMTSRPFRHDAGSASADGNGRGSSMHAPCAGARSHELENFGQMQDMASFREPGSGDWNEDEVCACVCVRVCVCERERERERGHKPPHTHTNTHKYVHTTYITHSHAYTCVHVCACVLCAEEECGT